MGSSMETGEFPESEGYEICISFFFFFRIEWNFEYSSKDRFISSKLAFWTLEKEKKVKSVLTLKRIVTEHIV